MCVDLLGTVCFSLRDERTGKSIRRRGHFNFRRINKGWGQKLKKKKKRTLNIEELLSGGAASNSALNKAGTQEGQ